MSNPKYRNLFVYLLVFAAIAAIIWGFQGSNTTTGEIWLTDLAEDIKSGRVQYVSVEGDDLMVVYQDGGRATTRKDPSSPAPQQLRDLGVTQEELARVKWDYVPPSDWMSWLAALGYLLPLVLVAGFIYLMYRQAQGSNSQAMSFGKSRARLFNEDKPSITFEDVAGVDEAKEELTEVVEFLREPTKFIDLGARIPKGVLLVGSPGTGKTLLAKAVSGEAGVPFFSISGSEFVEMFVGVGASRVRDLFDQAKRNSPCIVFVDEVDAVGRQRGAGLGGSHDEREQTLNQILVEMDGFDTDTNVIVMAATNRPDILDPALLRPGRFDRRVVLDRPDIRGREEILKVHVRGKPVAPDVDLSLLARSTPGFVGADIENLVNEAAIVAARQGKKTILHSHFEEAIERVVLGPERRSRIMTEDERRVLAYHEAGHAVVMHLSPKCNPVRKITIIPRGISGGVTWSVPETDENLLSRSKLKDMIAGALGGRGAEEIVFGDITTGAANDLDQVSRIARNMVTRYGMSEKLGPMIYGKKEELVFLGREIGEQRDYSEYVAQEIDNEVRRIVSEAHEQARQILRQNREKLDLLADRLLEIETVDRDEFLRLMGDELEESEQDSGLTDEARPSQRGAEESGKGPMMEIPPAPAPA